jgi:formyl-CoA transferase
MSLFGAIMMALYQREKTGNGAYVATSLAANGAWSNGMHLQGAIAGYDLGAILDAKGYRSPFVMTYKSRDNRYVVLIGPDPQREWPRVCKALGCEDWMADSRFSDLTSIMKHRDDLKQMFTEEFGKRNLTDLVSALDNADVTYGVVEKLQDVLQDAHLMENDIIVKTGSDNPDYQWTVNSPIEVGGVMKTPISEAPGVGQHSRVVLGEAGFSKTAIDELLALGVVKEQL